MNTQISDKLFMVYLGGSAPGANIELHDIRFVVAPSIEAAYPALRKQWFGNKKSVHMDSYMHVHHVDGYRIELSERSLSGRGSVPGNPAKQLYFLNFGGYFPGNMAEFHDFTLVVAESNDQAKSVARQKIHQGSLAGAELLHKDDLLMVDDCLALDLIDGFSVELVADGGHQPVEPDWMGYQPLS